MKLVTGLKPVVKRVALYKGQSDFHIYPELQEGKCSVPVPELARQRGHVYVVEFQTVLDSPVAPSGTTTHVHVLSKEPHITRRNVKYAHDRSWVAASGIEATHRRREGIPDDAIVTKVALGSLNMVDVTIEWYEVEL